MHELGCDGRHTARQVCRAPATDTGRARFVIPGNYGVGRLLSAALLELSSGIAAGATILLIDWWNPVDAGRLPPSGSETVLLSLLSMSFIITGLGWLIVNLGWVSILLSALRVALTVVMLGAFLETYLYGCESGLECETSSGWRLFQVMAGSVVLAPVFSALILALFGANTIRLRQALEPARE